MTDTTTQRPPYHTAYSEDKKKALRVYTSDKEDAAMDGVTPSDIFYSGPIEKVNIELSIRVGPEANIRQEVIDEAIEKTIDAGDLDTMEDLHIVVFGISQLAEESKGFDYAQRKQETDSHNTTQPESDFEEWKKVEGYPDYEFSMFGNVRLATGKALKLWTGASGVPYLRVGSSRQKTQRTLQMKKLVAEAFVPNPENLKKVEVMDGNELNCRYDNLKWV